jgi:hypothetical protein
VRFRAPLHTGNDAIFGAGSKKLPEIEGQWLRLCNNLKTL